MFRKKAREGTEEQAGTQRSGGRRIWRGPIRGTREMGADAWQGLRDRSVGRLIVAELREAAHNVKGRRWGDVRIDFDYNAIGPVQLRKRYVRAQTSAFLQLFLATFMAFMAVRSTTGLMFSSFLVCMLFCLLLYFQSTFRLWASRVMLRGMYARSVVDRQLSASTQEFLQVILRNPAQALPLRAPRAPQ